VNPSAQEYLRANLDVTASGMLLPHALERAVSLVGAVVSAAFVVTELDKTRVTVELLHDGANRSTNNPLRRHLNERRDGVQDGWSGFLRRVIA
jgi:hypothetical protein